MVGAGKMVQGLRALVTLPEDPGSVPNTYMALNSHLQLQSWVTEHSLLASKDTAYMWGIDILQGKMPTYIFF